MVRQLRAVYGPPRVYEVTLPLAIGAEPLDVRVGVSTVLLRDEISPNLRAALLLSLVAIVFATLSAAVVSYRDAAAAGKDFAKRRPAGARRILPARDAQAAATSGAFSPQNFIFWASRCVGKRPPSSASRKISTRSSATSAMACCSSTSRTGWSWRRRRRSDFSAPPYESRPIARQRKFSPRTRPCTNCCARLSKRASR